MNKFTESLYKLASDLHPTGMEDKQSTPEDEEVTFDEGSTGAPHKYIKQLNPEKDTNLNINKATTNKVSGPKFFSAEPSRTKVTIKQLNAKIQNNQNTTVASAK
jgi:hypothetical protein